MTLDTAANASPAFLTGNLLTRHAKRANDLLVSSGDTLKHRLYDMDIRSRWSSAESDDLTAETVNFGLWLPGVQLSQSFDYVAVMNHNVASMRVERSDNNGTSWADVRAAGAVPTDEIHTRVSLASPVDGDRLRFTFSTTKTANAEKLVGGIIVAKLLLQPSMGMKIYQRHPPRIGHKSAEMADRSRRRSFVYRSDASFAQRSFSLSFVGVSDDELEDFQETFLHRADPIIFLPEPGRRPGEAYFCQVIPGTYSDNYMQIGKPSAGSVVSFDLEEIGGA